MATTAQSIIDSASFLLNDVGSVRWTVPEMLKWITDGQKEAVILHPELNQKITVYSLAAGVVQNVTSVSDYFTLLRIARNIASDGATPGRTITVTSYELLDRYNPDWHTAAKQNAVKHYTFDVRQPATFQVYPPVIAGTKVEMIYSAIPMTLTDAANNISLADMLVPALVDYACYRALAKDSEFADVSAKASAHYSLFKAATDNISNSRMVHNPNIESLPFNPQSPPAAK